MVKQRIKAWAFGDAPADCRIRLGLLRGLRFHVDPRIKTLRLLGLDEREIEPIVRARARMARTALDVGANDGWYSIFFAAQANIHTVFSCEPDALCHSPLKHNLLLNREEIQRKVSLQPFFIGSGTDGRTRSVDAILRGCEPPYIVKIDVDGHELSVLHSAHDCLLNQPTYLIVETHSSELEDECIRYLDNLGYRCSIVRPGWYRRFVPEQRPREHNRWFYAEKDANRVRLTTRQATRA